MVPRHFRCLTAWNHPKHISLGEVYFGLVCQDYVVARLIITDQHECQPDASQIFHRLCRYCPPGYRDGAVANDSRPLWRRTVIMRMFCHGAAVAHLNIFCYHLCQRSFRHYLMPGCEANSAKIFALVAQAN